MSFTVRPATDEDIGAVCDLVEATMRGYMEAAGDWDADDVRRTVVGWVESGTVTMIVADDRGVGALRVLRSDTHLALDQIYLAPSHQRRGIGTELTRALIEEARAAARPIRLRVLRHNPAKHWYERLGFRVTDETPERFYLEWRPGT